jgi:hypothetical protein
MLEDDIFDAEIFVNKESDMIAIEEYKLAIDEFIIDTFEDEIVDEYTFDEETVSMIPDKLDMVSKLELLAEILVTLILFEEILVVDKSVVIKLLLVKLVTIIFEVEISLIFKFATDKLEADIFVLIIVSKLEIELTKLSIVEFVTIIFGVEMDDILILETLRFVTNKFADVIFVKLLLVAVKLDVDTLLLDTLLLDTLLLIIFELVIFELVKSEVDIFAFSISETIK